MSPDELASRRAAVADFIEKLGRLWFSLDDVIALCVPIIDAAEVAFSDPLEDVGGDAYARCCGRRCAHETGLFTGRVRCEACGAEMRDILSPMHSPILGRGNSWVSIASKELCEKVGERSWLVVDLGKRASQ